MILPSTLALLSEHLSRCCGYTKIATMPHLRSLTLTAFALLAPVAVAAQAKQGVRTVSPSQPPAPPTARAPGTGTRALLSGIVYDSLSGRSLSGATVIVSGVDNPATTDDQGRYHFDVDSIPEGQHTIGFIHPVLDTLGVSIAPVPVTIVHGQSAFADLAIPSSRTVVHSVCPDTAVTGGRGAMIGVIRDADTEAPIANAYVVAMWTMMSIGNSSISKLPKAVNVKTAADGSYRLCGMPAETPVRVQARVGNKATGWVDVQLSANGVASRSFLLGDRAQSVGQAAPTGAAAAGGAAATTSSGKVGGTTGASSTTAGAAPKGAGVAAVQSVDTARMLGRAVLAGTVTGGDGNPLEGAQISLVGTYLTSRTDQRGRFRLSGLPAGTQTFDVRLLSYLPKRITVDISGKHENTLAAVLDQRATALPEVVVEGKATSGVPEFDDRKEHGMGTYLTAEDIQSRQPISFTDVFRGVAGVTVAYDGTNYFVQMARANTGMTCPVQWYIDGSPVLNADNDMDQMMHPEDIAGVEIYKSGIEAPAQYQQGGSQCGVILVWTKRRAGKPKTTSPAQ